MNTCGRLQTKPVIGRYEQGDIAVLHRLRKITDRNVNILYKGVAYSFFEATLYSASILGFYYLLSGFPAATDLKTVVIIAVGTLLFSVIRMVLSWISHRSVMIEAYKITSNIRVNIANHLKKIPFGFFLKRDLGSLSNAILQDTNLLDFLLSHIFIRWVQDVFVVILLLIIMAHLSIKLFLVVACVLLFAFPFFLVARATTVKLGSKRLATVDRADSYLLEYLQGMPVMKSFGLVGQQNKKLVGQLKKLAKETFAAEEAITRWGMLFTLIIELGFPVLVYVTMAEYSKTSQFSFSWVLFMISYILMYLVMFDVMQYTLLGQHMVTATGRVEKMLQTPVQASPEDPKVPTSYGVTFTDVCFSYDTKQVLNNINFKAREKGMTALVGHSGAGKSTIASLMPLFWDTYSGKIDIGGVDIKDIDNRVLMDIFSFVFQDVYLFNDTIYNNILCGRKNAHREDVLEAAKKARCHEFITQLENGYDTTISEGGSSLSGGERQRISIARAILKNAPIVILDEVTTALDPINESYIQDAIGELIKDKTVIIIAHRLYTIINADCIVVLEKGRIIDMGKHAYLASECDVYRNMLTQLP